MTNEEHRSPYLTSWAQSILIGLQSKIVYMGTVDEHLEPWQRIERKQKRRTKNKIARKQRNVNRKNGSGK